MWSQFWNTVLTPADSLSIFCANMSLPFGSSIIHMYKINGEMKATPKRKFRNAITHTFLYPAACLIFSETPSLGNPTTLLNQCVYYWFYINWITHLWASTQIHNVATISRLEFSSVRISKLKFMYITFSTNTPRNDDPFTFIQPASSADHVSYDHQYPTYHMQVLHTCNVRRLQTRQNLRQAVAGWLKWLTPAMLVLL